LYLFIFESIGTSELLLIGVIALIFLGPRKMPEIARKIGKIMAEFRTTTNEFKSTWEREVNFEAEAKALDINLIEEELADRQAAEEGTSTPGENSIGAPLVKEIDPGRFDEFTAANTSESEPESVEDEAEALSNKRTWL
jgi:Tat protein translocase TatB subunit